MRFLRFLLRRSRSVVLLSLITGGINGVANSALIAVAHRSLTGPESQQQLLLWLFVGLCVLVPVTRTLSEMALVSLGQRAIYELRLGLCRGIVAAPLVRLEEIGSGRFVTHLTADVASIGRACVILPALVIQISVVLGGFVYLGWLSWSTTLLVLGIVLVGVVSYRLAIQYGLRFFRRARERQDRLYLHFRALTDGLKELKLHRERRQEFLSDEVSDEASLYRRLMLFGTAVYSAASSWTTLLFFSMLGILLFVLPESSGLPAETLTGYALVLLFLMLPLRITVSAIPVMGRAGIALERIRETGLELEEDAEERIVDDAPATGLEAGGIATDWSRLELIDVSHTYQHPDEATRFTVGPLRLTFRAGELVFITGGNGSGKTTLAKLLTSLYEPETGALSVDGVAVEKDNRQAYRHLFSVVFWDYFLFDRLLGLEGGFDGSEEGASGGSAPALDGRAEKLLSELQLTHKVEVEHGKLSTIDLSTGQRKRLALLTAYLEDRPIYVFDEWAADQDPSFKAVFYRRLLPELKARGKSVFVISHDDHYYDVADRLIKLTDGQVSFDSAATSATSIPC